MPCPPAAGGQGNCSCCRRSSFGHGDGVALARAGISVVAGMRCHQFATPAGCRGNFRVFPVAGAVIDMGKPAAAGDPRRARALPAPRPAVEFAGLRHRRGRRRREGNFEIGHAARRLRPVTGPVRGSPGARLTWKPECEIPSVKSTIPHVGKNSSAFRGGTITHMPRGRGNAHVQLLDRLQRARAAELLGHWPRRLSNREMSRTEALTILVAASSGHQKTPGVSAAFYDERAPRAEVRSDKRQSSTGPDQNDARRPQQEVADEGKD
jgi:hypothetical protein